MSAVFYCGDDSNDSDGSDAAMQLTYLAIHFFLVSRGIARFGIGSRK
jgi:hypothetical protein